MGTDRDDVVRLHEALTRLQDAQWARLMDRRAAGYTGWDNPRDVPDEALIARLRENAERLSASVRGVEWFEAVVDIANFAMFLWYRERHRLPF